MASQEDAGNKSIPEGAKQTSEDISPPTKLTEKRDCAKPVHEPGQQSTMQQEKATNQPDRCQHRAKGWGLESLPLPTPPPVANRVNMALILCFHANDDSAATSAVYHPWLLDNDNLPPLTDCHDNMLF